MAKFKLKAAQKVGVGFGLCGLVLIALFQNCSSGFTVDATTGAQLGLASTTNQTAGTSLEFLKSCRTGTLDLFTCLENSSPVKGVLKPTDVTRCTATTPGVAVADFDVAMCLTLAGFPIHNYREPLQSDIDTCSATVGTGKIATCLLKNGILPPTVNQVVIDNCVTSVGVAALEKCLRRGFHLVKIPFLSNSDVSLCTRVLGAGSSGFAIFNCLNNREVIPATVLQADIDTCLASAPTTIAKCLRTARRIPRVLMQNSISACNTLVGSTRIATCLDANGYLYDNLLPVTAFQPAVDACVGAAGVIGVARCLRTRAVLDRPILQAQINSCIDAGGTERVVACLISNGLVDGQTGLAFNSPAARPLVQADINACVIDAGPTGIARCLAGARGALNPVAGQAHFEACARFNDVSGIAACLDGSGVLPPNVTQANFDTCFAAAGIAGLETCMRTNGFIL